MHCTLSHNKNILLHRRSYKNAKKQKRDLNVEKWKETRPRSSKGFSVLYLKSRNAGTHLI